MANQEPWTVMRLLDWTRNYFAQAGLDAPRLCAEMLLSTALHCQRVELYARFNQEPSAAELATFRDWVSRAAKGEPVAYLVGTKEFFSLPFRVTPDVLIPRPETELLVENAVQYLRKLDGPSTVWDVCTGSGCVAIAIAHNVKTTSVLATDISQAAVLIATENTQTNKLADRVTCAEADLLTIPSAWPNPAEFDVITANPPYVGDAEEVGFSVDHEPAGALRAGPDGMDVIKPLIEQVPSFLKSGGLFCMEFGQGQADAVRDLIIATGQFEEPTIIRDMQAIERTALAKRK